MADATISMITTKLLNCSQSICRKVGAALGE